MPQSSADRIVADLRRWIRTASVGEQMPSTRELAARYGASPVTVQKATRILVGLGLIDSRPGAGSFVRRAAAPRSADMNWQIGALRAAPARTTDLSSVFDDTASSAIDLRGGYPAHDLLPQRSVRSALVRAARSEAAVSGSPTSGMPELRDWFAHELATVTPDGVTAPTARDVMVVPGTQSGLSSIFRAMAGPGRPILMESPTYHGALLAAAQSGVRVFPLAGDSEGPDPNELSRAFAETGARLFYAQPNFANPTGVQWSPARRERVRDVLREHAAFLVEDDWAHDFGIDADVVPMAAHDDEGHIVYLRSLSKSVSPSVRIGAVIARGPVRERIFHDRVADSMYVSPVLQAAAWHVVRDPAWSSHLRSLRARLRERRDLLVDALGSEAPFITIDRPPSGGLHLWARLPDGIDLKGFVDECERRGVRVTAGTQCFPTETSGPFIRMNYAGPDISRIPEAARTIGEAMRDRSME